MAYIIPSSAETLADQLLYTRGMLAEVTCGACQALVQVRKNSDHHTSIQWTKDAVAKCAEFAEMDTAEGGRSVHTACPRLALAIERAVADGTLPVGAGGADGVSGE